jgi:hypothetical protein
MARHLARAGCQPARTGAKSKNQRWPSWTGTGPNQSNLNSPLSRHCLCKLVQVPLHRVAISGRGAHNRNFPRAQQSESEEIAEIGFWPGWL